MRCGDLIDVGAASLRLPHLKPPGVGVGGVGGVRGAAAGSYSIRPAMSGPPLSIGSPASPMR